MTLLSGSAPTVAMYALARRLQRSALYVLILSLTSWFWTKPIRDNISATKRPIALYMMTVTDAGAVIMFYFAKK